MIRPHKRARVQANLILDPIPEDCCNADLSFPIPLFWLRLVQERAACD
jgi:hypothetical protein